MATNGKLNWIIVLVGFLVAAWGASLAYAYCFVFPKMTESIVANDRIRELGDAEVKKELAVAKAVLETKVDTNWKENTSQHMEILSKLIHLETLNEHNNPRVAR